MNYWYVARSNELFLDIDNVSKSIAHARARLQGAIECGKLDVAYVLQQPSKSKEHIHVIINLKHPMPAPVRFVWEILLHSDIYRGCCNLMRGYECMLSPDILISPFQVFGEIEETGTENVQGGIVINAVIKYLRKADDVCDCATKHNAATMRDCPAAKRLRGEFRNAGFFGKPSKNPCTIWPGL